MSSLYWSSAVSSFFSQASLLINLLIFLSIGIHHFSVWRRLTCQASWAPLPFRVACHRIPPTSCQSKLKPSEVCTLLFALISPLGIVNPTITWSLQSKLLLISTSPTSSSLLVNSRSRQRHAWLVQCSICMKMLSQITPAWHGVAFSADDCLRFGKFCSASQTQHVFLPQLWAAVKLFPKFRQPCVLNCGIAAHWGWLGHLLPRQETCGLLSLLEEPFPPFCPSYTRACEAVL